jgi:hypothetical protein
MKGRELEKITHGREVLGYEFSPIKTRSACKKFGTNSTFSAQHLTTNTDLGALRGMKALARAKS